MQCRYNMQTQKRIFENTLILFKNTKSYINDEIVLKTTTLANVIQDFVPVSWYRSHDAISMHQRLAVRLVLNHEWVIFCAQILVI